MVAYFKITGDLLLAGWACGQKLQLPDGGLWSWWSKRWKNVSAGEWPNLMYF